MSVKQALVQWLCEPREPWHLLVKHPAKGLRCHHLSRKEQPLPSARPEPLTPALPAASTNTKHCLSSAKWKAVHVEAWNKPKSKQVTLEGITDTITTERHSKHCWLGQLWIGRKAPLRWYRDDKNQPFLKAAVLLRYKVTLTSLLFCRKETGLKSRELT